MEITEELKKVLQGKAFTEAHEVSWALSEETIPTTARFETLDTVGDIVNNNTVCYSGVLIKIKKEHLGFATSMSFGNSALALLTRKEVISWLALAKKHKMLPNYTSSKRIVGEDNPLKKDSSLQVVLKLKPTSSLQQLYIYLTTVRYIREDPILVKMVLYLVSLGLDFFVALAIAHFHGVHLNGHSLLDIKYPILPRPVKNEYNLADVKALKKIVYQPKVCGHNALYGHTSWDLHKTIYAITKGKTHDIKLEEMDSQLTVDYINGD